MKVLDKYYSHCTITQMKILRTWNFKYTILYRFPIADQFANSSETGLLLRH